MSTTLILPGIGNSGPEHWQTRWERLHSSFRRVEQSEWEASRCSDWVKRLDDSISSISGKIVLVAHSSACALIAHWTVQANVVNIKKIHGALLVGPSDPTGPNYPIGPTGFAPVPLIRLPYPSIVVASTDDRYVTVERAREYSTAWHSQIVIIQNAGHINASSGLGDWPQGLELLKKLDTSLNN